MSDCTVTAVRLLAAVGTGGALVLLGMFFLYLLDREKDYR
jgi:hypothetical protein